MTDSGAEGAGAGGAGQVPGGTGDGLRRKVSLGRLQPADPGGETGARAWRVALGRAARDELSLSLPLTVARLRDDRRSLAELLDMPPERALIALLEGPEQGLGLIALSPDLMAAAIEMQTIGRLAPAPPPPRRPTRTDATMCAGLIDRALHDLETALAASADLAWAGGFRYASFLEDQRPLALLLEDHAYRVLGVEVDLCDGLRKGSVLLALPATGRGPKPAPSLSDGAAAVAAARDWSDRLAAAVMGVECALDAQIARLRLPLVQVMGLQPGQVLPLGSAALEDVLLHAADGRQVAQGRLGQNRGLRALRLAPPEEAGASAPPAAVPAVVATVPAPVTPPAEAPAPLPLARTG